ncbi:HET-domain-containing protein, partial [Paraphaeosphaeria sporulosa]
YFPLDISRREIRLLVVQPAVAELRDSPLEEQLSGSGQGDSLKYMALSYTWGDPEPTFSILLEGMDFRIRENLYEALLHFRPTRGKLVIWIDAVCINQEDEQERESQVAMMRDIYKEAEGVWAWLGPGDASRSRAAFAFLSDLAHREYSDVRGGYPNVLESPWFSRMWIIQEVVMGK